MRVVAIEILPIRLPLLRPVRTAHGELLAREGTLVRVETDAGLVGWGEASPYPGFGEETVSTTRAALVEAAPKCVGIELEALARAAEGVMSSACARAAFETARFDLVARAKGVPLCDALRPGASTRVERIPCNALLAETSLEELVRSARRRRDEGYETMKLKVGSHALHVDRERVAAVREAIGPASKLRLDANQAYDFDQARAAARAFAPFDIEYLEQPLAAHDLDGLARLRRTVDLPLAIDEGALDIESLRRAIACEAADVVVIKPSAAGGPAAALDVARVARAAGMDVVATTLLDSAVGGMAAIHSAAAIAAEGELGACGLATGDLFERDVAASATVKDGFIDVPSSPGLGIEVDPDSLANGIAGDPIGFHE